MLLGEKICSLVRTDGVIFGRRRAIEGRRPDSLSRSLVRQTRFVVSSLDDRSNFVNRLWIEKMKFARTIILTSNSIEETRHLADRLVLLTDESIEFNENLFELRSRRGLDLDVIIDLGSSSVNRDEFSFGRLVPIDGTNKVKIELEQTQIDDRFVELVSLLQRSKERNEIDDYSIEDRTLGSTRSSV